MKLVLKWVLIIYFLAAPAAYAQTEKPRVQVETSKGIVVLELEPQAAPKTVANFLSYVKTGFYDNTIFHRVIKGFMIQGGGLSPDMHAKPTQAPVANEADNGLKNQSGTIAMARTSDPHSATSQFFINVADNAFLDYKAKNMRGWGYCVFGKVIQGMEVVKSIEGVPTTVRAGQQDVPQDPIIITKVILLPNVKPGAE